MAFSTQKDFITPTFNGLPATSRKSEAQLKSYASCFDTRAWSLDNQNRSKYLADVVHRIRNIKSPCDGAGDGTRYFTREELEEFSPADLIQHILCLYENVKSKNCELKATEKLLHDASEKFKSIDSVIQENRELLEQIKATKEEIKCLNRKFGDNILEKTEENHSLKVRFLWFLSQILIEILTFFL